ncbi:hypothetical protein N8157_04205 [Burkholderiales bacterium]|nr:hypothetical protein [Burkholderiales bacterium]
MAESVESNLRGFVIDYQATEDDELKEVMLQELTDHNTAWLNILEEIGVNKESIMKATNFRHPSIDYYLDNFLESNEENVRKKFEYMKKYINVQ